MLTKRLVVVSGAIVVGASLLVGPAMAGPGN